MKIILATLFVAASPAWACDTEEWYLLEGHCPISNQTSAPAPGAPAGGTPPVYDYTNHSTQHGDGPVGDTVTAVGAAVGAYGAVTGNYGATAAGAVIGAVGAAVNMGENGTVGVTGPDAGAAAAGPDGPGIGPTGPEGGY